MSRQGEENLIQRWTAQAQVIDLYPGSIEITHDTC